MHASRGRRQGHLIEGGALLGPVREPQRPSHMRGCQMDPAWPPPWPSEGPSAPPVYVEGYVLMHLLFTPPSPPLLARYRIQRA